MTGPDNATVAQAIAANIDADTIGRAAVEPVANTPKPVSAEDGEQPDQDIFR